MFVLVRFPDHPQTSAATFTDDTTILTAHENCMVASRLLQHDLNKIENRINNWRIKTPDSVSIHALFIHTRDILVLKEC